MKLIIDIDEKEYQLIQSLDWKNGELGYDKCWIAVHNGIPLEDIKAEIKNEAEFAYADFERYKVECLGQDREDVYDSLPDDDFRYGMERCLEIIDKHIGGAK